MRVNTAFRKMKSWSMDHQVEAKNRKAFLHLDLDLLLESILGNSLESLLDVDGLLGGSLKVTRKK